MGRGEWLEGCNPICSKVTYRGRTMCMPTVCHREVGLVGAEDGCIHSHLDVSVYVCMCVCVGGMYR